jgi:hypothetical protein
MRSHSWIPVVLALVAGAARADDHAAARAVIEKAIVAHGGEAALARWPLVTAITLGTFHGFESTPVFYFKSEISNHASDRSRHILDGKLKGQEFRVANVLDGKRGWVRMEGNGKEETRDFKPAELEGRREGAYVSWISTLLPLKGPAFTLTLVDEEMISRHGAVVAIASEEVARTAVGVRVTSKGHRDVTLHFDKDTHLLVKTETRARAGTPVEGKVETFLAQHKAVEGVQRPMALRTHHNGKLLWSHWVMEYRVAEKAEADMFARP